MVYRRYQTNSNFPAKSSSSSTIKECDKSKLESDRRIVDIGETPDWMRTNPFIIHGYRLNYRSFAQALGSVFQMHNETVNIWTHLLGSLYFTYWWWWGLTVALANDTQINRYLFSISILSGILCFVTSSLYHTCRCQSEEAYEFWLHCDFASLVYLILCLTSATVYLGMECWPGQRIFHIGVTWSLALACLLLVVLPNVISEKLASRLSTLRIPLFACFGGYGIVPVAHWVIVAGFNAWEVRIFVWRMLLAYGYLGVGLVIWVFKIPERWVPGWCDYWFSSHQLWHISVVLGPGYFQYIGLLLMEYSRDNPCPRL